MLGCTIIDVQFCFMLINGGLVYNLLDVIEDEQLCTLAAGLKWKSYTV
jgi:hypothetical protein